MKSQILREFKGSAFRVDLTAEGAPFHADPDSVQTVLGHLWHHCGLTNATLLSDGVSSVDSPRFPPNGFQNEAASHEPSHTSLTPSFVLSMTSRLQVHAILKIFISTSMGER